MRLLHPRKLAALGVSTGVLALAACGGGAGAGADAGLPEGAAYVPADTVVFVSLRTDFASEQWQTVEELVARFPSGQEAVASLLDEIEQDGVDLEQDVKPALGPEVDIAVLDLPVGEDTPPMVLLTKPTDPGKLEALLTRSGEAPAWVVNDGWYFIAESQEILDRARSFESPLADEPVFADTLERLEGDPLARVFVNGDGLLAAVADAAAGKAPGLDLGAFGVGAFDGAAAGITAEGQGVRIQGVALSEEGPEPEPFDDTLAQLAPADALAYAAFGGADESLRELMDMVGSQTPDFDTALAQAQLALGISVEDDLLPIFSGPSAVWVRPGATIPELTLVLSPDDPDKALVTLDKLTAGLGFLATMSEDEEAPVTGTESIAGIEAKTLAFGDVTLYYAAVDDHVVVTTAASAIESLVADGASLADSPAFQEAAQAAGLPDETTAILYVDVENAFGALEDAGALDGSPAENADVLANAGSLDYLLLYGTGTAGEARVDGFLGIG